MDYLAIIDKFYPEDGDLRRLLLKHSRQVADRSLLICDHHPELRLDREFLEEAAMLHDIGIRWCHAPSICCFGDEPYICHGYIGAERLRGLTDQALPFSPLRLARYAQVCERHTGTGLTRRQIEQQHLPLPLDRSYEPETLEEQVICYADKFYSKSSPDRVRTVLETAQSLEKFGPEGVTRFLEWAKMFE